jgi:hypothetical protein
MGQTGTHHVPSVIGGVVSHPEESAASLAATPTNAVLESRTRRRRVDRGWVFTLVFFFAAGAFLVVLQWAAVPASISAARGHGRPGTATATDVDCGSDGGVCSWSGDYVSADRTISFRHVFLEGGGWPRGKPVAALYEGQSLLGDPLIFRASNHDTWIWEVLLIAFGCGLMILATLLHVLKIRGVVT